MSEPVVLPSQFCQFVYQMLWNVRHLSLALDLLSQSLVLLTQIVRTLVVCVCILVSPHLLVLVLHLGYFLCQNAVPLNLLIQLLFQLAHGLSCIVLVKILAERA